MVLKSLKKGFWVVLLFSLSLNIGFAITTVGHRFSPKPPLPPGPGRVLATLDRMDLAPEVHEQVTASLHRMHRDNKELIDRLFTQEREIMEKVGSPGSLTMEMVAPHTDACIRISQEIVSRKVRSIIEIRNLLGREKSLYLLSEIEKAVKTSSPMKKLPKPADQG